MLSASDQMQPAVRWFGAVLALGMAAVAAAPVAMADWTITLGAEARVLPSYEGSDRAMLQAIPLIDIRRAGTPRRFQSPRDGASIGILESGAFRLGPTAKLQFPRRERDDSDLIGLGNVGWTLEAGGFAEYWPAQWLRSRIEVRQGFGGHHGVVSDISADVVMKASPQLTLSGGPRLALASATALNPYFGITAAQAAASGLAAYSPSGGLRAYGLGAQARYEWTPRWASHFFVEYDRLTGAAANSPLVTLRGNRNQVQVGIGTTYSFDVGSPF